MNINEALYEPEKIRSELDRLMAQGLSENDAIDAMVSDVIATTKAESDRGLVHGEVVEMRPG